MIDDVDRVRRLYLPHPRLWLDRMLDGTPKRQGSRPGTTVAPTSRGAAILDRILFWRGRRAEIAAVDRQIDSVQQQIDAVQQATALLASQLVDLRAAVSDET